MLWTLFVIVLSAISGNTASKLMVVNFFGIDKLGHALFYFIMTWLWMRALVDKENVKMSIIISLVISLSVGYLMELGQKYWFEGRSFEYDDMVANAFGTVVAIGAYWWLKLKKKIHKI